MELGDKLYFGLVGLNFIDGCEIIFFFLIEWEFYLEFDLMLFIYELSWGDKFILGILSMILLEFGVGGFMVVV